MIWAIVGSRSCFCWLYRTFPSWLQLIQSMLFQYWPSSDVHVELALVLLEEGVCYDQCALNIVYVRSTCSPWDELAVQLLSTGTAIVELSWNGEDKKLRVIQFISVTQSCLTLCDCMDCSMPGLPVHHQLLEFTQTHVHGVGDAIQPSHPLSCHSPPAFNLSQHQGLFQWVSSSHQVAKVLEFQLQHQSFKWIFRTDFL